MIYEQQKYCDVCSNYFIFQTEASPNPRQHCPNCGGNGRDFVILSTEEATEMFFPYTHSSNSLNYGYYLLTTGNVACLTIKIPCDFKTLIEAEIHFISNVTGASLSVNIGSTYAGQLEQHDTHSESDTITKNLTTGKIEHIDLDSILTGIVAGDLVGIGLTNNTGGSLLLLGIEFTYIKNKNPYSGS